MTRPCGPAAASDDTSASRDLDFLQAAGAVRRFEPDGDGFVVELLDGSVLALPAEFVSVFRRGVLVGWRLPRDGEGPR
jgi:hypothetical protein